MRSVLLTVVAALLIGATGSLAAPALEKDRDALWKIVHNICVRHWVSSDDPWPCTQIVASDAVCSRPDAGLRHAHAATLPNRRSFPEAAPRLISL